MGADRRGPRGPGFVMSRRGRGHLRRLLEWIAKQSKSQMLPRSSPCPPPNITLDGLGVCMRGEIVCVFLQIIDLQRRHPYDGRSRKPDHLCALGGWQSQPAGTVFPAERLFSRRRTASLAPPVRFLSTPRCRLLRSSSILLPGDTVWKRCKAGRLAILNDAAAYFAALRETLLLATQQVYIIGWDIHSQTRFVGPSGRAEDGFPEELGPFLKALLKARAGLRIDILSWNFAALYAAEREWNSAGKFTSGALDRLRFCFDSRLPLGSSQHQKIVVIDGAVAFVGGLDLTIRRWDTSEHAARHPHRADPDGKPYPPFHDVQCMVDGEAAAALSELAETRWRAAGCTVENAAAIRDDRWPASVPVQARDITAGIARTEIKTARDPGVNEVARLFEASINAANRFIYIENQFTSTTDIARLLAQRMQDVPSLRVLIVTPKTLSSWFESQAMQGGRGGFIDQFIAAGVMDRICFLYPATRDADTHRGRHGAQQADDRRRLSPARGFGEPQQPFDGRGHRVRSRLRGDLRRTSRIHQPASPRAHRPFLRRGRAGSRKQRSRPSWIPRQAVGGTTGRNCCSRSMRRQTSAAWPASCNPSRIPESPSNSNGPQAGCGR